MGVRHRQRALAAACEGVVTRAQLDEAGVGPQVADRLVRDGSWTRLAPSVYLTTSTPPTDRQLVAAASHHVGPDVVVTGLVACRALDLRDVPDERAVDVLTVQPRVVSSRWIRVHETQRVPDTWRRWDVGFAEPVRAVVDGGRALARPGDVTALLLGAVAAAAVSPQELRGEVDAGPQQGSGLVRRAVDDAEAGAWSAPEAAAGHLLRPWTAGGALPPFLLNPVVEVAGEVVGQPDGWFVGTRVGWQVDSVRHHGSAADLERTLGVHDGYARHGLVLLHVTPSRLRRGGPDWVAQVVAAVRSAGPAPSGLQLRATGRLQDGSARRPLAA